MPPVALAAVHSKVMVLLLFIQCLLLLSLHAQRERERERERGEGGWLLYSICLFVSCVCFSLSLLHGAVGWSTL